MDKWISLTWIGGKLFKTIIMHLMRQHRGTDTQHGLMKGTSCLTDLFYSIEELTTWLDCGSAADLFC